MTKCYVIAEDSPLERLIIDSEFLSEQSEDTLTLELKKMAPKLVSDLLALRVAVSMNLKRDIQNFEPKINTLLQELNTVMLKVTSPDPVVTDEFEIDAIREIPIGLSMQNI